MAHAIRQSLAPQTVVSRAAQAPLAQDVVRLTMVAVYLGTLAAYDFYKFPLPWAAYLPFLLIFGIVFKLSAGRFETPPSVGWIGLYVAVALLILGLNVVVGRMYVMPQMATLPYSMFIAVRFITLLGYLLIACTIYNIGLRCGTRTIERTLECVLLVVVLSALYIYVAQTYGLWEPPRNRQGTGGQNFMTEGVTYNYGFHRATGTFREPSHLAIWLLGPGLIVLTRSLKQLTPWRIVLLFFTVPCLVLTGSLVGFLGLFAGLSFLVILGHIRISLSVVLSVLMVLGCSAALMSVMEIDFMGTLGPRVEELFYGGISATNRGSVWEYLFDAPPPWWGYGVGNSNLVLSEYMGIELVASHLSVFSCGLCSLGITGLALVVLYLAGPFLTIKAWTIAQRDAKLAGCFAALAAWLVFYFGHNEEFADAHALLIGLFWARVRELSGPSQNAFSKD